MELTEKEVDEIDEFMNEHMYGHTISNSPSNWTCDFRCRKQALKMAIERALSKRDVPDEPDMSTYEAGQQINHPSLTGVWTVTHDQPLPHRHINVTQGANTAQVTADAAVEQKDRSGHVLACTDAWRRGQLCIHETEQKELQDQYGRL